MQLTIKDADGLFDLSERSLGFRWFFMFLLMTSYSGLDSAGTNALLLLDEPASNLHSTAQIELLKSFERLGETCKLIYTTHSHHMINVRWLDSALVVKNEALGDMSLGNVLQTYTARQTNISATPYRRFVNDNPSQTSYFQPVLDVLDYRPSTLDPIPDVVLVEGKTDFYLLRYAIDVLGFGPAVALVPGTGAGSLAEAIRMYAAWGKEFVVLLDGDAEGRKQKERYEVAFGPIVQSRCLLVPDLCGDAKVKAAEGLLSPDDIRAMCGDLWTDEKKSPTKKALHQALLERFAAGEAVTLSFETPGANREPVGGARRSHYAS